MRITRVRPRTEAAAAARVRVSRVRETVWLALASCLVGFGLRQVYHSRDAVLAEAERRLAAHETLLLARLTPAAEISRYLGGYSNPGQRQLVATKIADLLRHEQPENVGALGRLHVTRAEAQRRGAFDLYRERFVRAEADSIRLFSSTNSPRASNPRSPSARPAISADCSCDGWCCSSPASGRRTWCGC